MECSKNYVENKEKVEKTLEDSEAPIYYTKI